VLQQPKIWLTKGFDVITLILVAIFVWDNCGIRKISHNSPIRPKLIDFKAFATMMEVVDQL